MFVYYKKHISITELYPHGDTCSAYHTKGVFLKLEIGTVSTKPVQCLGQEREKNGEKKTVCQ